MSAEYAYYVDGNKIAILKKYTSSLGQNGVYVDADYWATPDTADANAILFQFNVKISAPTTDTSDINANDILSLGIVEYVKYRLYEDLGDYVKARYHYKQFKIKIYESTDNRLGSPTIVAPPRLAALR
jgi:hypothetical protein